MSKRDNATSSQDLYLEGLELARSGHEELAITKWKILAEEGDLNSMWAIMVALGRLGKVSESLKWRKKLPEEFLLNLDKGVIAGQVLSTGDSSLLYLLKIANVADILHELASDPDCDSNVLIELVHQHSMCCAEDTCCYVEDDEVELLSLIAREAVLSDALVDLFLDTGQPFYTEQYSMADMLLRLCRNETLSEKSLAGIFTTLIEWPGMAEAHQYFEMLLAIEENSNFSEKLEKKFEEFLDTPHWNNPGTVRENYQDFLKS